MKLYHLCNILIDTHIRQQVYKQIEPRRLVFLSQWYCVFYYIPCYGSLKKNKNRTEDMQRTLERRMGVLNETVQSIRGQVIENNEFCYVVGFD